MSEKKILTHADCIKAARVLSQRITEATDGKKNVALYGVPRGGIPVTYMVAALLNQGCRIAERVEDADVIVDDIVDSGRTRQRYVMTRKPFLALFERGLNIDPPGAWLVYPWEQGEHDTSAEDNVVRLLQYVGEDPQRGGLLETPRRMVKAWEHYCSGYKVDPASVLKVFEDGAEKVDEMITVRNIPFYSQCEHHLAPFFGTATISYVPNGKIVGLSKLSRLLDVFARRLQVQERLTNQVADAMVEHLGPKGVGVMVRARHLCMEARGVAKQGHETITTALRGAIKEHAAARAEFLHAANGH